MSQMVCLVSRSSTVLEKNRDSCIDIGVLAFVDRTTVLPCNAANGL